MVTNKEELINEDSIHKIYSKLEQTFKIKNKNYGNSFEKSIDKYGLIAALTRLADKFNRAEELILRIEKKGSYGDTDDESLQDTLLDMANYCAMTVAYIGSNGGDSSE